MICLIFWLNKKIFWSSHRRLRMTILKMACLVGQEHCIEKASQEFRKWLDTPYDRPHPDVRELIYSYGKV